MKKGWFVLGALIIGMALTLSGCGQKGGTVTFTNDSGKDGEIALVVWEADGSQPTPTQKALKDGEKITASLDKDGKYFLGGYCGTKVIGPKTGDLVGGESVDLKASDF